MIEPYNNESPYMYIDANIDNDRRKSPNYYVYKENLGWLFHMKWEKTNG